VAVVSALYVYPVKSCRGIRVTEWQVVERGFVYDRRWMIVDKSGQFVTMRELPELTRVTTRLSGERLQLDAPGLATLELPLAYETGEERPVQVWGDAVQAVVHPGGSAWFSSHLGAPHSLVYMPESERRQVNPARARSGDIVSFADAYPFLVISEASLADLNARLPSPVTMDRFRPNIVVSGTAPFAEDDYSHVRMGEISFRGPKRCERCVITSIDPETGAVSNEPQRTLATYRREGSKVWFGMNLIHDSTGTLRVGDAVNTDV